MRKHSIVQLALLGIILVIAPPQAMARNAGLLLAPTRVVLEKGERFVTVTVRNNGDATGRYKIEMVDATMDENGALKVLDNNTKPEFSARDMISLSPSNMTLNPDEFQVVRLLVKKKSDLPDGEYRAHLQVRMTESDLTPEGNRPQDNSFGIAVKVNAITVIPVIIRKGETSFNVTVDDAKLLMGGGNDKQAPEVKVSMSFSGNRSVVGNIKVTHIASDGKETQVGMLPGVAIYRGVVKRNQTVSLKIPEGSNVNIHSGRLRVDFLSQESEGSHVLSEKVVTP